MTWIYLSKNGTDEYMHRLATGSGAEVTPLESWDYDSSNDPLVLRGIMKHKIIKRCWQDHRQFRYMDSGYFGNRPGDAQNPNGWKHWHRIVDNNLQHQDVVPRPDDRWNRLGLTISPPRRKGNRILVVAPDEKPCAFYGITLESWMSETLATIKQHTDRPVDIRERRGSRVSRKTDPVQNWLANVYAVVTFNSVAATESVLAGVPAFVTAPCNAAIPVANTDLTKIHKPWYPDAEQVHAWACHLAYGQFHIDELADGTAARILQQTKELSNA
jgi:hypothetical protein